MSITRNEDGTVMVTGADIGGFKHDVDEADVNNLAGMVARRSLANQLHESGLSWRTARERAGKVAEANDEMKKAVRTQLEKGANPEEAIRSAMKIAN